MHRMYDKCPISIVRRDTVNAPRLLLITYGGSKLASKTGGANWRFSGRNRPSLSHAVNGIEFFLANQIRTTNWMFAVCMALNVSKNSENTSVNCMRSTLQRNP